MNIPMPHLASRIIFSSVIVAIMFADLFPNSTWPESVPYPDLIFCWIGAWVMRRPSRVPLPIIVALSLAGEVIFLQPPGLWTALVVAASEFLRGNVVRVRLLPFYFEWLLFSITFLVAVCLYQLIHALTFLPGPEFGRLVSHVVVTCLCYPIVVFITNGIFRIRKATPIEAEKLGSAI